MDQTVQTLGASDCVTGSCHLLRANGVNILVDCGLRQERSSAAPMDEWPVRPSEIHYLFITHAHIDHIGRVPELIEKGFKGEIIATDPTKALLVPMLEDALSFSSLSEGDAARLIESIEALSWGFEYGKTFDLKNGIRFKLGQAGHILGSCFIRFEIQSAPSHAPYSVLFSGDLGASKAPLLPDPDPPDACDLLILESTYGDRLHEEREERVVRLGEALSRALSDKGKVLIPCFALGRAQELIYELDRLFTDPKLKKAFPTLASRAEIPVCLDSPLGLKITRIYSDLKPYWDSEAKKLLHEGDHPLDFKNLYAVTGYRDHMKLVEMDGPAVILAGSGMCSGGRIVDHLKHGLQDPRNDLFFVGYQAEGTPGREILRKAKNRGSRIELDGESIPIRAKIHALTGYSAHADQRGLIGWVKSMPKKPSEIRLVHGEPPARNALASLLAREGCPVRVEKESDYPQAAS